MLFDSHKDVIFGKNFGFWQYVRFSGGGNQAQKWTKTTDFGYVSFPLNHLVLKDCSKTVFSL